MRAIDRERMREFQTNMKPDYYDGAWPVECGYDPRFLSKYVAEELAPYIIGFTACPNFRFDGRIGSSRVRSINTDDVDDAIRQSILEFKKYPGQIVLYEFKRYVYPDPDTFLPRYAYKTKYARLPTAEEEQAWQDNFINSRNEIAEGYARET